MKFVQCSNCKRRVPNLNYCEYCREPFGPFKCDCGHDTVKPTEIKIIPYEAKADLFTLQIDKVTMVCTKCFKEYEFAKDDFDFKKLNSVYFSKRAENEALKYANICKYCKNCETFHFTDKCEITESETSQIKNIYIMNLDKLFNVEQKTYRIPSGTYWFDDIIKGGFPNLSNSLYYSDIGPEKHFFEVQFVKEGLKNGEALLVVIDTDPNEFITRLEETLTIKVEKYFEMGNLIIIDLYSCEELNLPPSYDGKGIIRSAKDLTSVAIAITKALSNLKKKTCKRALLNIISYVLRISERHLIEFTRDTLNKLKKEKFTVLLTVESELIDQTGAKLYKIMDNIIESNSIKKEIDDKVVQEKRIITHLMKNTIPDPEFRQIRIIENKMYVI